MDQNKNELAIANKYDVNTSLFGDNNRKEFTSLNPNEEKDMDMLLLRLLLLLYLLRRLTYSQL